MTNLVKTTVTIPEDLLQQAKLTAVKEKITLSDTIRQALADRIYGKTNQKNVKDPMKLAGKYKIGIKKIYHKRSDLYDKHIVGKMGY